MVLENKLKLSSINSLFEIQLTVERDKCGTNLHCIVEVVTDKNS